MRVSTVASTRELGALFTMSSTLLEKPVKSAFFQFHRSSVIGGGYRMTIWQSTDITIGRCSDPIQSVVDHSTMSSQLLCTSVTSGALLPPEPALVRVAEPSFATPKSKSHNQSSSFAPIASSGCHLSHVAECTFRSPPMITFFSDGSSDVQNSLP